jgi:hypothetical protein
VGLIPDELLPAEGDAELNGIERPRASPQHRRPATRVESCFYFSEVNKATDEFDRREGLRDPL